MLALMAGLVLNWLLVAKVLCRRSKSLTRLYHLRSFVIVILVAVAQLTYTSIGKTQLLILASWPPNAPRGSVAWTQLRLFMDRTRLYESAEIVAMLQLKNAKPSFEYWWCHIRRMPP